MTEREMKDQQQDRSRPGKTGENPVLNIAPYLSVARELSGLLVPVPVRPAFRAQLEQSLLTAARRQAAQRTLDIEFPAVELSQGYRELAASAFHPVTERMDRRWLMGAAVGVGSAFSLAGLMAAYVWRQRRRRVA